MAQDTLQDADNDEVRGPGKLKTDDFVAWKESLQLKLQSIYGHIQVPLFYIICDDWPAGVPFPDEMELLIYEARLVGRNFNHNNKRVANYIMSLVQPTDAYKWVKNLPQNDRCQIFQHLVNHYEGKGFAHRTFEQAQTTIDTLVYTNEATMSWDSFATKMMKVFVMLDRHNSGKPILEQLRLLCKKIRTHNTEFNTLAKTALQYNPAHQTLPFYIRRASENVSTKFLSRCCNSNPFVAFAYPSSSQMGTPFASKHVASNSFATMLTSPIVTVTICRRKIQQGKGAGLGCRQPRVSHVHSDLPSVVSSLSSHSYYLHHHPHPYHGHQNNHTPQQPLHVSQVSFASTNSPLPLPRSSPQSPPVLCGPSSPLGPPIGGLRRACNHNNNNGSVSVVKYGNICPLVSAVSFDVQTLADTVIGFLDEDSHADMNVAGWNCIMLSTSGFSCNVAPFHSDYAPRTGVEIVKAAIAFQHPSGICVYLVMGSA